MIINFSDLRERNAIKVGLAATLATWLSLYLYLPNPFLAGTVAILSFSYHTEATLGRLSDRFVGTIFGAITGLSLIPWVADSPILLMVVLFCSAMFTILGFLSKGALWLNFGICAFLIFALNMNTPAITWQVAIWRVISVTIGVGVVALVDHLLGIDSIKDKYQQDCQQLEKQLHALVDDPVTENKMAVEKLLLQIKSHFTTYAALSTEEAKFKYLQLAEQYQYLALELNGAFQHAIAPSLVEVFKQVLTIVSTMPEKQGVKTAIEQFNTRVQMLIQASSKSEQWQSLLAYQTLVQRINNIYQIQINWREPVSHCQSLKTYFSYRLKNTISNLNARPDWLIHAAKVGLAVLIVVYLWLKTDWYGGLCAILTVLATGSDSTLEQVKMKSVLRFWGTVVGFLLGAFCLAYVVSNVYSLLLVIFVASYGFAYMAYSGFKQMYFAWMACMAFSICVVSNDYMVNNLTFSAERTASMLLSWLVVYFVMTMCFPTTAENLKTKKTMRLRRTLAKAWQLFSELNQQSKQDFLQSAASLLNEIDLTIKQIVDMGFTKDDNSEVNQLIHAALILKNAIHNISSAIALSEQVVFTIQERKWSAKFGAALAEADYADLSECIQTDKLPFIIAERSCASTVVDKIIEVCKLNLLQSSRLIANTYVPLK
jgi:uncharacterized membrane protein YccC